MTEESMFCDENGKPFPRINKFDMELYNKELEKQSEEYVRNKILEHNQDLVLRPKAIKTYVEELKQAFQDGVKWGIEHAVEWHDLRKDPNDLPKECENVLCFCYGAGVEYYGVGHFVKSDDLGLLWWSNSGSARLFNVISWCELPQFKE